MSLIRCITGSESFATGSASLIVTVHGTTAFPVPGPRPKFISEAAKEALYIASAQRPIYLPSSNNGVREQGCYWDGNYTVPDGMILRVLAKRRARSGRVVESSGVVFLRAREDAALQRLTFNRIDHHQSTGAPVIIEGRFDVLSLRDVAAAGGAITVVDLTLGKANFVQDVLTLTEVAPARRAPAKVKIEKVTAHDGSEVIIASTRTKRATNLG